ncbi:MAG: response regulator [Gammaproteobacteria bacterium]
MDTGSPSPSSPTALRPHALVVDDDCVNRLVLAEQLTTLGYAVTECADGRSAVIACASRSFDLVFMDVMMPLMDGIEATRQIRALPTGHSMPVLFLTALADDDTLERCLAAGGDDFLTKPANLRVLSARIGAIRRRQELYARLHHLTERERRDAALAERILDNAVTALNLVHDAIRARPWFAREAGNAFHLAARAPSGDVHVLLGGFTGQGLAAAIAALPTAEVFHAMVAKGFAPEQVLRAIDAKLCALLPPGLSLGAQYVVVQADLGNIRAANCGLPALRLVGPDGAVRSLASASIALGVDGAALLPAGFEDHPILPGTRVLLCAERGANNAEPALEILCSEALVSPTARSDDTTTRRAPVRSGAWDFALRLHGAQLREIDPVPLVLNHVGELLGDAVGRAELFTIVTELYVNALDHGVLKLDSKLKRGPTGFIDYMQRRADALARLDQGWVSISLRARFDGPTPHLCVCVADSGAGFNPHALERATDGETVAWGRGFKLLHELCSDVAVEDGGTRTTATYSLDRAA